MYFGACYYAEHWPEERWSRDAELMKEAGFNAVRMTEFAWTRIESREGVFNFDWLDRCIGLLADKGIKVILGTPTASPPKWIMDRHPDLYKRDMFGHVRGFGTRMHYCFNNPAYPEYVRKIVRAMVERYRDNPNVIGWQIDNEFGCADTTWCYCDGCKKAFQHWLKNKYNTINAVNDSWGTVVWNNTYSSFDEIELPKLTTYQLHNPGLQLDFRRFSSEAVVNFQRIQVSELRSVAPHQPITHNMMGTFGEIDYYKLARDLDVSGLDIYPNFPNQEPVNPYTPALHHDITRGIKQSNYWVLEHQSGTPGGNTMFTTPRPGEIRRWTYQSIAHGADAIIYFRWRTALFGGEQFWHGILQHSGESGRKYEEVQRIGEEMSRLSARLQGSEVHNDIAIVRCYENEWIFDIQPQSPGYKYINHLKKYHRALFELHTGVDIVSPDASFEGYRLLVLPNLSMASAELITKIHRFADNGGTVVIDFRSGIKAHNNQMLPERIPGPFQALTGVQVDDYGIIRSDAPQTIRFLDGSSARFEAACWYDIVESRTAETVAEFDSDYFAGRPAITRNRYGKGTVYYVATEPETKALVTLLASILDECGVPALLGVDHPEVEVVARRKEQEVYLFVINHAAEQVQLQLQKDYFELIGERLCSGSVRIEPNDVLILVER